MKKEDLKRGTILTLKDNNKVGKIEVLSLQKTKGYSTYVIYYNFNKEIIGNIDLKDLKKKYKIDK